MCRRRIHHLRILQKVIQDRCRDTQTLLLSHIVNHIPETMDTLLRQRRAEEHRHIGRKWQTILDLLLEFHHRIRLFGDRIPFVHEKEQALPCLVDVADDLLILLRQLIDRIQYKDRHITVIDGTDRTDDAVFSSGSSILLFFLMPAVSTRMKVLPL